MHHCKTKYECFSGITVRVGGRFKNVCKLVKPLPLKSALLNKLHIFWYMGKIFCVEFPLKFHTKYLAHTLKDTIFSQCWRYPSPQTSELVWIYFDPPHYDDVIMSAKASQITSLTIVYSTVYSGADQSKHQSSASLSFVCGMASNAENVSIWWRHHAPSTTKNCLYWPVLRS